MRLSVWLPIFLLAGCVNSAPQPSPQACATVAEPWKAPRIAQSARDGASAAEIGFLPGEAIRLSLHPDGEVAYRTLPQGEGEPASFGGMASVTIERAGIYSLGLSEPIWVDISQDGKPAEAVRYGPGAACTGIRKAVTFNLAAGEHVIELSGSSVREVGVLVTPVP